MDFLEIYNTLEATNLTRMTIQGPDLELLSYKASTPANVKINNTNTYTDVRQICITAENLYVNHHKVGNYAKHSIASITSLTMM